jgi:hypothetical protein
MFARLTVLLFCAFLLLSGREPPWADANIAYQTTQSIVDRHELAISLNAPSYFFVERSGKKYGFATLGTALGQVPSYLTYKALRRLPGLPQAPWFAFASHLSSALWMAMAIALFARMAQRYGASPRLAVGLSLLLAFATLCLVYARSSYGEALQTLLLTWFVDLTLQVSEQPSRRRLLFTGLCAGLLLNAKLVYGPVILIGLGCYLLAQHRRGLGPLVRDLLLASLGALPGLALLLAHNYVKTGHPLRTGYQSGQLGLFDGNLLAGLHGLLLSPGRGLFFYAPPLVLSLLGIGHALRTQRRLTWMVLGTVATVAAISAKYPVWHGGYCFGPRYLVPLIPLVMLLAVPWLSHLWQTQRSRLVLAVALTGSLGAGVAGLGSALYWDHYCRVLAAVQHQALSPRWSEDHHAFGYYIPQFSPISGHLWLLRHLLRHDPDLHRDAPWKQLLPATLDLRDEFARLRIDLWTRDWLYGPHKRYGFTIYALLVLGIGLSTWGLSRSLRRERAEAAERVTAQP